MSRGKRDNLAEEVWVDPELEESDDVTPGVRMMNRRGKVVEVHPAQVERRLSEGWELAVA